MGFRCGVAPVVAFSVVIGAMLFGGSTPAHAEIYRAFLSLELGMPLETFVSTIPSEEMDRRDDERVFWVPGQSVDVEGVNATFTGDRLSRIEVVYVPAFSARVSWKQFVATAERKYGSGFHLPIQRGDVEMWDDGRTTLILERRALSGQGNRYVLILLDDAVALERSDRCQPSLEV